MTCTALSERFRFVFFTADRTTINDVMMMCARCSNIDTIGKHCSTGSIFIIGRLVRFILTTSHYRAQFIQDDEVLCRSTPYITALCKFSFDRRRQDVLSEGCNLGGSFRSGGGSFVPGATIVCS